MAGITQENKGQLHRCIGHLAQTVLLFVLAGIGGWGIMVAIPKLYTNSLKETSIFVQGCGLIIAIEIFINWLCTKLVSSKYDPVLYGHKPFVDTNSRSELNSKVVGNTLRNSYLQSEPLDLHGTTNQSGWTVCRVCKHSRPFRSHHCSTCNACILRRDHHCYFIGSCIGHRNLRNFIVFLFWTTIGTLFATGHMFPYYYYYISAEIDSAAIHPFICLKRVVLGELHFRYFILTSLGWSLITYTIVSAYYLKKYIQLVLCGRTSHEQRYFIKTIDNRNTKEKLKAVFGPNWILHFLNPLHFLTSPLEHQSELQCVKLLEM